MPSPLSPGSCRGVPLRTVSPSPGGCEPDGVAEMVLGLAWGGLGWRLMGFTHRGGGGEKRTSLDTPPAYGSRVPEPVRHGEPVPVPVMWLFDTSGQVVSSSLMW